MSSSTPPKDSKAHSSSYGQILKSSSIIGGAQGLNYLIGIFRIKIIAILLGPAGVGMVGLYQSATALIGSISGLGIASSGVREVAEAHSKGETEQIVITTKVLKRASWATGFIGWILTAALAYPLSVWTFGSSTRATALAMLGVTLLLNAISAGQMALLQGTRRIKDLAIVNVLSVLLSTLITIAIYALMGESGIVPVLIVSAGVNVGFSWWFARKLDVQALSLSWRETWKRSKRFIPLGAAFMLSTLVTTATALIIRGGIVREFGIEANGIYQAAWGLSGMFAGFILGAMGTDFYPRLTGVSHDNQQVNQLVNEQIEIGVLLALPGILATITLSTWAMTLFYSNRFMAGAELLPWFTLGVFGRVISWPLGYVLLAKGSSRWYALTEIFFAIFHVGIALLLLRLVGLVGIALAFTLLYAVYNLVMAAVTFHLTSFCWSKSVIKIFLASCIFVSSGFLLSKFMPDWWAEGFGCLLTLAGTLFSLRGISSRLGTNHPLVKIVSSMPGGGLICGL